MPDARLNASIINDPAIVQPALSRTDSRSKLQVEDQPPDLHNDVLPMLDISRWWLASQVKEDSNGRIDVAGFKTEEDRAKWHHQVYPALQLASLILSTDSLLGFWTHIAFSHLTVQPGTGKEYLSRSVQSSDAELAESTKHWMGVIGTAVHFEWFAGKHHRRPGSFWAFCSVKRHGKITITLNTAFQQFPADLIHRRVFWTHLALILCHEFAHAAYIFRHRVLISERAKKGFKAEIFHSVDAQIAEMGRSFEIWLWRSQGGNAGKVVNMYMKQAFERLVYMSVIPSTTPFRIEYITTTALDRLYDESTWDDVRIKGREALAFMLKTEPGPLVTRPKHTSFSHQKFKMPQRRKCRRTSTLRASTAAPLRSTKFHLFASVAKSRELAVKFFKEELKLSALKPSRLLRLVRVRPKVDNSSLREVRG